MKYLVVAIRKKHLAYTEIHNEIDEAGNPFKWKEKVKKPAWGKIRATKCTGLYDQFIDENQPVWIKNGKEYSIISIIQSRLIKSEIKALFKNLKDGGDDVMFKLDIDSPGAELHAQEFVPRETGE